MSKLNAKRISVFRYWATGLFLLVIASIPLLALIFFQGFFLLFRPEYGISLLLAVTFLLCYAIAIPYILGRFAFQIVSTEILLQKLEARERE